MAIIRLVKKIYFNIIDSIVAIFFSSNTLKLEYFLWYGQKETVPFHVRGIKQSLGKLPACTVYSYLW